MAHEITLEQAAERAHQAEVICRMLESHPDKMDDSEYHAMASLLAKLTGDVCAWLMEEQSLKAKSK